MAKLVRDNAVVAVFAAVGLACLAWLGLGAFAWTDYDAEAAPAFAALTAGHVHHFLALAPVYGGSLVLRAPFALAPKLWGGGQLAVYRMVAVPCLLAAGIFGVWLVARMRRAGQSRLAQAVALGLCVASPVTLLALQIGHPEELLGTVLCVAALILARDGRGIAAGALLGLAVATKAWALLAVLPVIIALPARRWQAALVAAVVAGALLAPLAAVRLGIASSGGAGTVAQLTGGPATTAGLFKPPQVWWWLGSHPRPVPGADARVNGARSAPAWLPGVAHPLIIALAAPLTLLFLRRRRREPWDELLLLAVLFMLRCALDPWNNVYYALPFLFALLAWEVLGRRRAPWLTASVTVLQWVSFERLPLYLTPDRVSAAYLAWALPLTAILLLRLYAPDRWSWIASRARRHAPDVWQGVAGRLQRPVGGVARSIGGVGDRASAGP